MTDREMLIKQISALEFASLDLQLYLDTHPEDKEAIEKMNMFKLKAAPLIKEYEDKFGPLTKGESEGNNWSWIKAPWPWESEGDL